jgi:cellulose synthase/poly-beta-1,6-N-acetylglucosamine synthase-like glycosyltransferase
MTPHFPVSKEVREQVCTREIRLTALLFLLTLASSVFLSREIIGILSGHLREENIFGAIGQTVFILIISLLIYGNLVYQCTRLGHLRREMNHSRADEEELESLFDGKPPSLTILVPSYKENVEVVRRTLLSAALQDYPDKHLVLLIDDPPNSISPRDRIGLKAMRDLPGEIQRLLDDARKPFDKAFEDYLERRRTGTVDPRREYEILARQYRNAAAWFSRISRNYPSTDHGDALLVEKVFRYYAHAHEVKARSLLENALGESHSEQRILRQYRRLTSLFRVRLSSFERKKFVNLSREANKAMNLNSYIGLIGRSFRQVLRSDGLHLEPAAGPAAELTVPDTDFLITLDADSLLTPDYGIRLIHHMNQPGNVRVAVAQTPYNTIPGAPGVLERIAGATTDIQYLIHQGFTAYGGTYWVGANALLRKAALDDIAQSGVERGFPVTRYVQDRTVIEDTESSIDLIARGWTLYNYPERMAFSATPPDFGSLVIQRRRWANGGLLILPKLLGFLSRGPNRISKVKEGFFRFHYLFSITAVNFGLLVLFSFPFEENARSVWLPLTALPYFYLYGRDLAQIGYRWIDLPRVYSLNLLLIPVNIAGVLDSIRQGISGRKVPFGRTPKVENRTATPVFFIFAEYALFFLVLLGLAKGVFKGLWIHSAFCLFNLAFLAYAIVRFIGLKESREDLALAYHEWEKRKAPRAAPSRISLSSSLAPARVPIDVLMRPAPGRSPVTRPLDRSPGHF